MNENQKHREDLSEIRNMMEKASKFISLSGISGILAGITALTGVGLAWWYLYVFVPQADMPIIFKPESNLDERVFVLSFLAIVVFILATFFAVFFTTRQSRKKKIKIWDFNTRRLLWALSIPLLIGALFILALIFYKVYYLVLPASLLFYGLSLINGSHFTYSDIRFLGYFELLLGVLGLILPTWGLLIWSVGFGLLHIIYGIIMYFKYEK